jgi:hypothetical protein
MIGREYLPQIETPILAIEVTKLEWHNTRPQDRVVILSSKGRCSRPWPRALQY